MSQPRSRRQSAFIIPQATLSSSLSRGLGYVDCVPKQHQDWPVATLSLNTHAYSLSAQRAWILSVLQVAVSFCWTWDAVLTSICKLQSDYPDSPDQHPAIHRLGPAHCCKQARVLRILRIPHVVGHLLALISSLRHLLLYRSAAQHVGRGCLTHAKTSALLTRQLRPVSPCFHIQAELRSNTLPRFTVTLNATCIGRTSVGTLHL